MRGAQRFKHSLRRSHGFETDLDATKIGMGWTSLTRKLATFAPVPAMVIFRSPQALTEQ